MPGQWAHYIPRSMVVKAKMAEQHTLTNEVTLATEWASLVPKLIPKWRVLRWGHFGLALGIRSVGSLEKAHFARAEAVRGNLTMGSMLRGFGVDVSVKI